QRWDKIVLELLRRTDMNRRWNHIIARLPHVDVVVRMNRVARTNGLSGQLTTPIRNHLVRVRVCARAGTSLENIEWKMLIELALHHFFGRLDDQSAPMRVEQAQIRVRLCCGPFDETEGTNERPRKSIAANRKIEDGPLRRCT